MAPETTRAKPTPKPGADRPTTAFENPFKVEPAYRSSARTSRSIELVYMSLVYLAMLAIAFSFGALFGRTFW